MKIVKTPSTPEKSVFLSDFSGKEFPYVTPEVRVTMEFNYGSQYDGARLSIDLFEKEASEILEIIFRNLHEDSKKIMKHALENSWDEYVKCADMRDWQGCDQSYGQYLLCETALKNPPPRPKAVDDLRTPTERPASKPPKAAKLSPLDKTPEA